MAYAQLARGNVSRSVCRTVRDMLVRGTPAVHARRLARRALTRLAQASAAVLAAVLAVWFAWGSSLFGPVLVLAVPVALIAGLGARRFNVEYLKASTGVRAEDRVARVLSRGASVAVLHGALIGRGDVDHVVLGPRLVAVETKHGRGEVTFDRDGTLRVGGRRLPRDPVGQVRANASLLAGRVGRAADAVVVIVDASSPPQRRDGVWVCSLAQLPAVLEQLPARIDMRTAESFARSLPVAG